MNHPKPSNEIKAVAIASADDLRERIRQKSKLKGRQADDASLAEVKKLIGDGPYRRDLLIENLHLLNDAYRALHDRHLVALAKLMNLPMAEVYEVATFYHHFEVVRAETFSGAIHGTAQRKVRTPPDSTPWRTRGHAL